MDLKYLLWAVLAALLIAAGWFARDWYGDSLQLQIEQIRNDVALSTSKEIAKIKVENKTIYNKTIEKIKTEIVYQDCNADDTMMSLTNKALTGK